MREAILLLHLLPRDAVQSWYAICFSIAEEVASLDRIGLCVIHPPSLITVSPLPLVVLLLHWLFAQTGKRET